MRVAVNSLHVVDTQNGRNNTTQHRAKPLTSRYHIGLLYGSNLWTEKLHVRITETCKMTMCFVSKHKQS